MDLDDYLAENLKRNKAEDLKKFRNLGYNNPVRVPQRYSYAQPFPKSSRRTEYDNAVPVSDLSAISKGQDMPKAEAELNDVLPINEKRIDICKTEPELILVQTLARRLRCGRCNRIWLYKGRSKSGYTICPSCKTSVSVYQC